MSVCRIKLYHTEGIFESEPISLQKDGSSTPFVLSGMLLGRTLSDMVQGDARLSKFMLERIDNIDIRHAY